MKNQISIVWCVEDVQSVRPDLSDEQCMNVLYKVKDEHDANIGINWEVIEAVAEYMYPKGGI